MKCLIVVDYQNDFVAAEGALTAGKPAIDIESNIYNKITENAKAGNKVFFTMDSHSEAEWQQHPESNAFGIHCKVGEPGWQLYGKVAEFAPLCEDMGNSGFEYISKSGYCPKNGFLNYIVKNYTDVEIIGVVTDICVFQTAIGLYNSAVNSGNALKFTVFSACTASFNAEGHDSALKYMSDILGIKVI